MKRLMTGLLLLLATPAAAELIRVDITGVTVPEVPIGQFATAVGRETTAVPFGTPFIGHFVYNPSVPPLFGVCGGFAEADGCQYDAIVSSAFTIGPLDGSYTRRIELETAQVVDAQVGASLNIDVLNWYFPTDTANLVDNTQLELVQVFFSDATNTVVHGHNLPVVWELDDFDAAWAAFHLLPDPILLGRIQTLQITEVPEPGTLVLLGLGLAGLALARRRA